MEAILVATDFSETSKNAALYAIGLASQIGVRRIVLYHSYEIPVSIDPIAPTVQMMDVESLKTSAAQALLKFRYALEPVANGVTLESLNEYGILPDGLDDVCAKVNAGLIVTGIRETDKIAERLIGTTGLAVARHSKTPVMIVPEHASFHPIRTVMLTSDFDGADESIPVSLLSRIIEQTKAKLLVFHFEGGGDHKAERTVHSLLQPMDPEYVSEPGDDFLEAVHHVADSRQADLLISIPKERGFFERLFHTGHTKKLAFHSHLPLLLIHNW